MAVQKLKLKPGTKIYLGLPYSDKDPAVMHKRFQAANQIAAVLMKQGHIVFSPISHSHPIAVQCDLPGDYDYWKKWNRSFLSWCDVFIYTTLDGWQESTGLRSESGIVSLLGKPVIEIDPYIEPFNVGKL